MMSQSVQMQLKIKVDYKIILLSLIISLALCYLALFLEYRHIFTLDYFVSQSISYVDGYEWYRKEQSIIWLNVAGIFVVVLVRAFVLSLVLYTSHKVANIAVRFIQEVTIASIATTVFSLNYLVTVGGKVLGLIPYTFETANNNYRYQSVNVLLDGYNSLYYLEAPLDLLNISQVVFLVILVFTTRIILNPKTDKSKLKISTSTLVGYLTFLFLIINVFVLINIFQHYE